MEIVVYKKKGQKMQKIKNYLKENRAVIFIFVCFFTLVYIQHQFLYMYHDDFAYASLSYAYNVEEVKGTDFNFNQLMEFLKGHYNVWGGRILYFFFEIVLLKCGVDFFRLIQSIVITLVFFMIYKIVRKSIDNPKVKNWLIALISVMGYGIFEIMLLRSGIFWFTASILYIFPILPLSLFIYLYQDSKEKNKFKNIVTKTLFYIFNALLIFLATFSQEQIALAALSYIVFLTIYNWIKNKKIDIIDVIMLVVAIITFAVLMLAPGNAIRRNHSTSIEFYSMPFIKQIIKGTANLIFGIFSNYTKIFNMLLYFTILYITYNNFKYQKGVKILTGISFVSIIIILMVSLFNVNTYFEYVYWLMSHSVYKVLIVIVFVFQILLMIYSIIVYFIERKEFKLIGITIAATLSEVCMIVAPYFVLRSAIIFQVLVLNIIIYVLLEIYDNMKSKKAFWCFLTPVFIMLSINYITITKGYYINSSVNENNDNILKEISSKIKEGEKIDTVEIKKLPDILYSGEQPYIEGSAYIEKFIKEYYDLPMELKFIYVED